MYFCKLFSREINKSIFTWIELKPIFRSNGIKNTHGIKNAKYLIIHCQLVCKAKHTDDTKSKTKQAQEFLTEYK